MMCKQHLTVTWKGKVIPFLIVLNSDNLTSKYIYEMAINGISSSFYQAYYHISSPISPVIFFIIWHKKLGDFSTRNGVQLIAKGLGFKDKYKLMLTRNDCEFCDCSALYMTCFNIVMTTTYFWPPIRLRKKFFILSRAWDKEKNSESPWGIKPQTFGFALQCSTTEPQRLFGEQGLLRSSYDTCPAYF